MTCHNTSKRLHFKVFAWSNSSCGISFTTEINDGLLEILIKPGDVIAVREKSKTLINILEAVKTSKVQNYSWLEFDSKQLVGKFIQLPNRDEIPENINEQLIVELFSK